MGKDFYTIKNKSGSKSLKSIDILMHGEIVDDSWWGDDVSSKKFAKDLQAQGDVDIINLYINSPGGSVFAGQAIYSVLKRHKAHVNVYVDGLAASIASVIAMAGDTVIMPRNTLMMVHKAWTSGRGNANDFKKLANDLEKIEEGIISAYEDKTGLSREEIMQIMEDETWLSAEECIELGFADRLDDDLKVAASINDKTLNINGMAFDLSGFKNMPKSLIQPSSSTNEEIDKVMTNQNPFKRVVAGLRSFLSKDDVKDILDALREEGTGVDDGTQTSTDANIEEAVQSNESDETTKDGVESGEGTDPIETETKTTETEVETEGVVDEAETTETEVETSEESTNEEQEETETETEETPVEDNIEVETQEIKDSEDSSVNAKVDPMASLQAQIANLQSQVSNLQSEKAEADEKLAFNKFKEENLEKFTNLVGKEDEIVNNLYAVFKSNLDQDVKDFIFKNLQDKSDVLADLTQEIGTTEAGAMTVREEFDKQAKELAKVRNITIEKARATLIEKDRDLYNALRAEENK